MIGVLEYAGRSNVGIGEFQNAYVYLAYIKLA